DGVGCRGRGAQLPRDRLAVVPVDLGPATPRRPDGGGTVQLPTARADRPRALRALAVHTPRPRVQRPGRISVPAVHRLPQPRRGTSRTARGFAAATTGMVSARPMVGESPGVL